MAECRGHLAEAAFAENLEEVEVRRRVLVQVGRRELGRRLTVDVADWTHVDLFTGQHLSQTQSVA